MVVGRGRATKYAIRKSIHNQSSYQPLYWTSEAGVTRQLGLLHYLGPDNVYVDTPAFAGVASGMLPWYLSPLRVDGFLGRLHRSEEHTSKLQSLMRISYAVFCLNKKNNDIIHTYKPHLINHQSIYYTDS